MIHLLNYFVKIMKKDNYMSVNKTTEYVTEKLTFTKDKLEVYPLKHEKYQESKSSNNSALVYLLL